MQIPAVASLRARLLILNLLAIIPLAALTLEAGLREHRDAASHTLSRALMSAESVATTYSGLVHETEALLMALSELPLVRQGDSPACSTFLADLVARFDWYANLGVVDLEGNAYCSATPLPPEGLNLADRSWFQRALQSHALAVGDYQISRATHTAVVNFAYPMLDEEGDLLGVVVAAVDLSWLGQSLGEAALPPGSNVTIFDSSGTVLARAPDAEEWVGESASTTDAFRAILAQGGEGTAELPGLDGTPFLFGFTPIEAPAGTLYVSVGVPTAWAYAEANRLLARNLALLALVTAFSLLAAWSGGYLFIRRQVNRLLDVSRQLASGDLTARTHLSAGGGELGELARSFDQMAAALQERVAQLERSEEELHRANRAYRVLSDCNLAMLRAEDEASLLQEVCRIVVEIGGYCLAWVGYVGQDGEQGVRRVACTGCETGSPDAPSATWPPHIEQGCGPARVAIRTGQPIVTQDVLSSPDCAACRAESLQRGYAALISLPLLDGDQAFGVLNVCADQPDAFAEKEVTLLQEMAGDLAYGILALRRRAEHQQAEEALREAEAHYRVVSENSIAGVYIIQDGRFCYVNPALASIFGYTPAEMTDRLTLADIVYPDDAPIVAEQIRCRLEGEDKVVYYQVRAVRRDGSLIHVEILGSVADYKGRPAIIGTLLDITEQHRARQRTEQLLRHQTIINQFTLALSDSAIPDQVYRTLHEHLRRLMDVAVLTIALYNEAEQVIQVVYAATKDEEQDVSALPLVPLGEAGYEAQSQVIRTGEPLNVPDFRQAMWRTTTPGQVEEKGAAPREVAFQDTEGPSIRSALIAPLKSEGRLIGVVQVQSDRLNAYTQDDLDLLAGLANMTAIALHNARLYQVLSQRATQMTLINEIGRQVAAALDIDSVLNRTAALLRASFGYDHVAVYLIDRQSGEMRMRARAGQYASRFPSNHRLGPGQGLVGWAAQHGQRVLVTNTRTDPRFYNPFPDEVARSELSVPIRLGDEVLGVLDVQSQQLNAFTEGDLMLVDTLADVLATAIHNARLYGDSQRRAEELESLRQVALDIASQLDLDTLLDRLVRSALRLLGVESGGLYLYRPDLDVLEWAYSVGPHIPPPGPTLRRGEGLSGRVWETGTPLIVEDYDSWEGRTPTYEAYHFASVLAVPIRWGDDLLGVFNATTPQGSSRRFSEHDVHLLSLFADQAAVAIQNARLYQNSQRQAAELEALRKVTLDIFAQLDLYPLLASLIENAVRLLGGDSGGVYLYQPDQDVLEWVVGVGATAVTPGSILRRGEGLSGRVWESGEPLIVERYATWEGRFKDYKAEQVGAVLGVPIRWGDIFLGVINVSHRADSYRTFNPQDVRLLSLFADQAAVAIHNARLYQELETYNSILQEVVAERTEELIRAKGHVEAILDAVGEGLIVIGMDGRIRQANPAFLEQTGYSIADIEMVDHRSLGLIENAPPETQAELAAAVRAGQGWRGEMPLRRRDGTTFDAAITLSPMRNTQGEVTAFVGSVRDITPLKEVQRMKDEFVSNVSHELRTPITGLKLNHRLLEVDPGNRAIYAARIGREIDRLNLIVEGLLRLSRLDQGRQELHLAPLDLNMLGAQYVLDRMPLAESRGLALTFEGAPELAPVQADQELLGQALSVLLTNALAYTPAGGAVTVFTDVRHSNGECWAGLGVRDTGPGIAPDEQSRLFERFFRGRAGVESREPGTGLGLSIAHEIVERHRGSIEVYSEGVPGQGTRFTIWLPAMEAES